MITDNILNNIKSHIDNNNYDVYMADFGRSVILEIEDNTNIENWLKMTFKINHNNNIINANLIYLTNKQYNYSIKEDINKVLSILPDNFIDNVIISFYKDYVNHLANLNPHYYMK